MRRRSSNISESDKKLKVVILPYVYRLFTGANGQYMYNYLNLYNAGSDFELRIVITGGTNVYISNFLGSNLSYINTNGSSATVTWNGVSLSVSTINYLTGVIISLRYINGIATLNVIGSTNDTISGQVTNETITQISSTLYVTSSGQTSRPCTVIIDYLNSFEL